MKRINRHRVKTEKPETSAGYSRDYEEHDLAYYIHDRVELMHQVFSVLKYKDLKAMAPECVRNLPIGDLQELCTEELLGISSKRLLATLDGCEPPSDTESSSGSPTPDPMETISLDSISSDEELLSQASKKKKHKHRRSSRSKSKKNEQRKAKDSSTDETMEVSKASRAGLTVLELLELQARARAIRAQLQNEQAKKQSEAALEADGRNSTDDEIEIKEEAPDVVEISSGDEKPDISALQAAAQKPAKSKEPAKPKESPKQKETSKQKETLKLKEISKSKETSKSNKTAKPKEPETSKEKDSEKTTVTRRISDLIITVPQTKATRKIKLKRNNVTVIVPNVTAPESRTITVEKPTEESSKVEVAVDKSKKKKKNKKKKTQEKEGSDHDEITLQLSDSEKMDLLEDLNEKNYDKLSTSSSDSDSISSDSEVDTSKENVTSELHTSEETVVPKLHSSEETEVSELHTSEETAVSELHTSKETTQLNQDVTETLNVITVDTNKSDTNTDDIKAISSVDDDKNGSSIFLKDSIESSRGQNHSTENIEDEPVTKELSENNQNSIQDTCTNNVTTSQDTDQPENQTGEKERQVTDATVTEKDLQATDATVTEKDLQVTDATVTEEDLPKDTVDKTELNVSVEIVTQEIAENSPEKLSQTKELHTDKELETEKGIELNTIDDIPVIREDAQSEQENTNLKAKESDRNISEGELTDRESSEVEVFDIEPEVVCISDDEKQKKKKKKKDKKAKKQKKSKKSKQDFREGADQNFYKDAEKLHIERFDGVDKKPPIDISDIDDDVYEILELSDDSSCYEVEGTVLSKEPTAEEIEALSARIDEIKREDVVNDLTNDDFPAENDNEPTKSDESEHETENICWKDRYLDSKKVKRVLTTANILNALRKKNKELKRKIEEAKKKEKEAQDNKVAQKEKEIVLEGSIEQYQTLEASKYVISVTEQSAEEKAKEKSTEDEKAVDEETVTREMKKDAKHLMKMFKKLLNSRKNKRREKKKKRKLKKQQGGDTASEVANLV